MTAYAGIVSLDGAAIDSRIELRIRSAIGSGQGQIKVRRADGALFVQRNMPTIHGAQSELPPVTAGSGGKLFAAEARLDNRAELGAALAIAAPELARTSDTSLILQMQRRWGDAGIARCLGSFAFALWDTDKRRLILGRDCLGTRALFFYRDREFVAFASTLNALLSLPRVPRELDGSTLANYLALNLSETRRTFYRGIERVPSRTIVEMDRNDTRHRYYWSPDFDAPPPYRRDQDYIERARELLDQAVATATADTPRLAISTSGGLDSSAIAATAARLGRAESITCYTTVPPAGMILDVGPNHYLDERDKLMALARMHPALTMRFCVEGALHPFEQDATRFFAKAATPILNPSNLGAFIHLYDAVSAAGHTAMLIGASGNFGLTWSGQYSFLALMRAGKFATLIRDSFAAARREKRGFVRTLAGGVLAPAIPLPLRRLLHRLRGRDPDSVARFSALNPALIADSDLAGQWRSESFDPWFQYNGWNAARHRARFLFDRNQFARDHKSGSEGIYGFEIRDPLGDRRLLEFLLAVPEPMYRRHGIERSFARAVLADRLPREILDEPRRGRQNVTWFRRMDARRQDIAIDVERLEASPLASRILDLPRIKGLLARWPKSEEAAELHHSEFKLALDRGLNVGRFIRWVEGGNA